MQHYVDIGILCDLAPPAPQNSVIFENLYVEVNMYVTLLFDPLTEVTQCRN